MKQRIVSLCMAACIFVCGVLFSQGVNSQEVYAQEVNAAVEASFQAEGTTELCLEYDDMLTEPISLKAQYSDDMFLESAYQFNRDLALLSLILEMSSFTATEERWEEACSDSDELALERCSNLAAAFEQLGFSQKDGMMRFFHYGKSLNSGEDTAAHGIAAKPLPDGTTLVAVVVRGGGYGAEWGSNFHVGDGEYYHRGFKNAQEDVLEHLQEVLSEIDGEVRIWITGFSRGAAVANLLAAALDELSQTSDQLSADWIFAYTFGTPRTATEKAKPHEMLYHNIFNLILIDDPVPYLPVEGWGYTRFGITCELDQMVFPPHRLGARAGKPYLDQLGGLLDSPVEKNYIELLGTSSFSNEDFNTYDTGSGAYNQALLQKALGGLSDMFRDPTEAEALLGIISDYMVIANTKVGEEWLDISDRQQLLRLYPDLQTYYAIAALYVNTKLLFRPLGILAQNDTIKPMVVLILALAQKSGQTCDAFVDSLGELAVEELEVLFAILGISLVNRIGGHDPLGRVVAMAHFPLVYLSWMKAMDADVSLVFIHS